LCLQAIIEGESAGVDGYLIDLRNNPGGVFEEAIAMASYFLDSDNSERETNIVETVRTSNASRGNVIDNVWTVGMLPTDVFSRHAWGLTTRPVAIITNRGSASASEVRPSWQAKFVDPNAGPVLQDCPPIAVMARDNRIHAFCFSVRVVAVQCQR
jgi:Peptidase family S41